MILASLLLATGLLIGGSLLIRFWNNIISWLKRAIGIIQQKIRNSIYGTNVYIKQNQSLLEEKSIHYSKDNNMRWTETVVTRNVNRSEVPQEILDKAIYGRDVDITRELELQLT